MTSQLKLFTLLIFALFESRSRNLPLDIHFTLQIGIKHVVVFVNKADLVDDEMLELVELEIRDLLTEFGFDGNDTPVVQGSALSALQGKKGKHGEECIHNLLRAMDNHIPLPQRDTKSPLLVNSQCGNYGIYYHSISTKIS